MNKKSEDEEVKSDLASGCEAAERVLHKANEAVNRDMLDEALEDLIGRVDDWKNHKVESFGKLLLHGVYGVITGKTDQEKDVCNALNLCIYLGLTITSTRSTCSNAFSFAARRFLPTRVKTRRTKHGRLDPRFGIRMLSFS